MKKTGNTEPKFTDEFFCKLLAWVYSMGGMAGAEIFVYEQPLATHVQLAIKRCTKDTQLMLKVLEYNREIKDCGCPSWLLDLVKRYRVGLGTAEELQHKTFMRALTDLEKMKSEVKTDKKWLVCGRNTHTKKREQLEGPYVRPEANEAAKRVKAEQRFKRQYDRIKVEEAIFVSKRTRDVYPMSEKQYEEYLKGG